MVASVIHYNRHSRQPDWLNKDMIAQGIDSTPISLWNWGIEHGFGKPNIQSPELVYLHLLPKAKASVQAGGIYFEGMFYTSQSDEDRMKFARARAKGREPIDIWHDSTKPEYIWIRNEDKSFTTYHLRASEVRYRGHRLEEIVDMLHIIKQTSPENKYTELVSKVQLDDQVQSIIHHATTEKKLSRGDLSAAQQVAGIRGNRTIERIAERASHTNPAVPTQTPKATPVQQPTAMVSENYGQRSGEVIDLLSRLRKK